jgi:hypothetical protein
MRLNRAVLQQINGLGLAFGSERIQHPAACRLERFACALPADAYLTWRLCSFLQARTITRRQVPSWKAATLADRYRVANIGVNPNDVDANADFSGTGMLEQGPHS